MITKDSDYLNNKLQQLKTSVLNKNSQLDANNISRGYNYSASQKYVPTYDEKDVLLAGYKSPSKVAFQGPSDSNLFQYGASTSIPPVQMNQTTYPTVKLSSQAGPSIAVDSKRPYSTQIIENLKQSEVPYNGIRSYPIGNPQAQTINLAQANQGTNSILNPMEPKVKTVHAVNSRSFVQTEPVSYKQSNFQMPQVNFGTDYSFRNPGTASYVNQTEFAPNINLRTTTMTQTQNHFPERTVYANIPDPQVLQAVDTGPISEKSETKILQEIQAKISAQADKNMKLGEDIMSLRNGLETERNRVVQLDQQLKEEYKHVKVIEAETQQNSINLEQKLNEIIAKTHEDDERFVKMKADLEKIQVENEMLRGELKRLGEITSEKILDLENNINSVARMKDFENENFVMEKDKVGNSADFVIEQMKVHFNDRSHKIEEQMRQIQIEKDKITSDLKLITDELKNYNSGADLKINNIMNAVIQEEQEKHQAEVREVENKVRLEEEEISRLNRKTQDLINKLQTTEREGKNRLMSRKGENTRLKEDLSNFEQNYNKILIQVSNENREYEKKKELVDLLKEDFEEVHNKSQMLDHRYEEEMQNIQAGHEESLQDIDKEYGMLREKEQRLQQLIKEENDKLYALQKRHTDIIEQVQRSLNDTLGNQFNGNK